VNIFGQKTVAQEVGSSTMPHKVNPIDFENAEGNFGIARNLANHMADKLPISRKQRDLSDSTVQRSLGTLFGHYYLAKKSLLKGLKKITPREDVTREELENHWEVLAEPIQMILRRYGVIDAYEKLKEYSRGKALNKEEIKNFVETLNELPEFEKKRLLELTPATYTGLAEKLTKEILSLR
jgi:adenylosuccinate lyase